MTATASQMRALTTSVRDNTRRREEIDLKIHIAAWRGKEKQKAKDAIAKLPEVIKAVANSGKHKLIVRVEVTNPYLTLETSEVYKEIDTFNQINRTLDSEVPATGVNLSIRACATMRDGAKRIARWAIRHGFGVRYLKWNERKEREDYLFRNADWLNIDNRRVNVLPTVCESGNYPLYEGFVIMW